MAISTAQYIDLLFKKLNGVAKTATAAQKSSSNESIASPPLLRGDIVWTQSDQIPSSAQVVAGITQGYLTTSRIECVPDTTVPTIGGIYPTWLTNLTDWIPQEFGSTWPVKIYVDTAGAADPTVTGTQIFSPGIGGVGEFFFDTQAGLLNFIGETIPSTLTAGKSIFVVGYRYVGLLGVTNLPDGTSIGNLQITGNTIVSLNTNGDIVLDPNGTGQVVISTNLSVSSNVVAGNISTVGIANIATLEVTGNATVVGNIAGSYFLGNGAFLTGIDATSIQNGNSNVRVTANGNVTVGVAGTSNVVVFANTGLYVNGVSSVSGNITANGVLTDNYYYANGAPVDFEQPAGSNTWIQYNNNDSFGASGALVFDSASNIFTVGGNIVGNNVSTNVVTSTGQLDITSAVNGNILLDPDGTGIFKIIGTNGFVVPVGNTTQRPDYPTYATVDTGTLRLNSTLNQLEIWNGAIWSIVGSDSGNTSVIDQQITPDGSSTIYVLTQDATAASIIVSLNGVVQIPNSGYTVTGNSLTFVEPPLTTDIVDIRFLAGVTAPSVLYNSTANSSVQVTDTPDIVMTVNNTVKARVNAVGLSVTGNITGSGNVAGTYFIGNGAFLTGVASSYGNADVANYLASGTDTANIITTGNISGGNLVTAGDLHVNYVLASGNIAGGNVNITGTYNGSTLSVTGNVNGGNVNAAGLSLSGNVVSAINTTSAITTTANITGGNISATNYTGTTVSVTGNITAANFFGNGNTLSNVATRFESFWTVPVGNSTQSFTVGANETYQMWVDCNIPNGILAWNATATVTNTNVPVVGVQYAWVYSGGGTPIDFTSIPNQFVGTANTIVRSSVAPSATTNRFDFGLNNTSGGNVTVRYGWVAIS
jgi:hypothetical protein